MLRSNPKHLFRLAAKILCYGTGFGTSAFFSAKNAFAGNIPVALFITALSAIAITSITLEEVKSYLEKKTRPLFPNIHSNTTHGSQDHTCTP